MPTIRWEELLAKGLGELGLSPPQFWSMTLRDLHIALKGFYELEDRRHRSRMYEMYFAGAFSQANLKRMTAEKWASQLKPKDPKHEEQKLENLRKLWQDYQKV